MMLAIVFVVSDTVVYVMLFFVLGLWFLFLIWLCMFVPFNRWLFFLLFFLVFSFRPLYGVGGVV